MDNQLTVGQRIDVYEVVHQDFVSRTTNRKKMIQVGVQMTGRPWEIDSAIIEVFFGNAILDGNIIEWKTPLNAYNKELEKCGYYLKVKELPLKWQSENRTVRLDSTMLFSPGYDFEGLESKFEETVGLQYNFIIWPDGLSNKCRWNLYGGEQGWFQNDIESKEAAKEEVSRLVKSLKVKEVKP